jgi:cysteine desulfurase/selenocysteine lyase
VSPPAYESGLVAFADDDPETTVERLADAGLVVRDIPPTGTVRVSVHAFNTAEDIDALLDAL